MKFKNLIGDLFGFNQEIINWRSQLTACESKYLNTIDLVKTRDSKIVKLKQQIEILSDQYDELTKPADPLEEYWNSKYPTANIEYNGRTFGTSTKMIPIDVRLLVTPQDYHIHDILAANNLYYESGSIDDHIVKLYHFIKAKYYRYVFDQNNYGITEYWEFPYEMLEALRLKYAVGFDCDSWASFIVSFLIASGVPSWKARVVIGNSVVGGHSTVYVHCDATNKFHHINSTMGGKSSYTKLSDYPTTNDAGKGNSDALGIYNVWLSYNNVFSWHKFSSAARSDFKKEKGKEFFNIN